jgi:hypothetical protein
MEAEAEVGEVLYSTLGSIQKIATGIGDKDQFVDQSQNNHANLRVMVGVYQADGTLFLCYMSLCILVYIADHTWIFEMMQQQICMDPLSDLRVPESTCRSWFVPHKWSSSIDFKSTIFIVSRHHVARIDIEPFLYTAEMMTQCPISILPRMGLCRCGEDGFRVQFIGAIDRQCPQSTLDMTYLAYIQHGVLDMQYFRVCRPADVRFHQYLVDHESELVDLVNHQSELVVHAGCSMPLHLQKYPEYEHASQAGAGADVAHVHAAAVEGVTYSNLSVCTCPLCKYLVDVILVAYFTANCKLSCKGEKVIFFGTSSAAPAIEQAHEEKADSNLVSLQSNLDTQRQQRDSQARTLDKKERNRLRNEKEKANGVLRRQRDAAEQESRKQRALKKQLEAVSREKLQQEKYNQKAQRKENARLQQQRKQERKQSVADMVRKEEEERKKQEHIHLDMKKQGQKKLNLAKAESRRVSREKQQQVEELSRNLVLIEVAEEQRLSQLAEEQLRLAQAAEEQRLSQLAEGQLRLAQAAEEQRLSQLAEEQRLSQLAEQLLLVRAVEELRLAQAVEEQRLSQVAEELRLVRAAEDLRVRHQLDRVQFQILQRQEPSKQARESQLSQDVRMAEKTLKQQQNEICREQMQAGQRLERVREGQEQLIAVLQQHIALLQRGQPEARCEVDEKEAESTDDQQQTDLAASEKTQTTSSQLHAGAPAWTPDRQLEQPSSQQCGQQQQQQQYTQQYGRQQHQQQQQYTQQYGRQQQQQQYTQQYGQQQQRQQYMQHQQQQYTQQQQQLDYVQWCQYKQWQWYTQWEGY